MKNTYLAIIALIGLLMAAGCSAPQDTAKQAQNQKIIIATTFYPLYDLTKSIVGDKGTVYSIVPAGVEPHDYEPNPSDLKKLSESDAFVIMGVEFAEFEEDLGSANPNAKIIPASTDIPLLKVEEGEEADDGHSGEDPHIWLSPKNAQKMALNIMNGLVEADPANGEAYLRNGQKLIDDLNALDQEFKAGLSSCKKDVILVNHNAFSYLAHDYGFSTIEISGLEPETEPTPKQLAELIEEAEEHDIKYVFYEELVDSRIAGTIAEEVGAQTLELNPLEGTSDPSATYSSLMRENLKNLEVALECQ